MTDSFREVKNTKIDTYVQQLAECWDTSKDSTETKLTEFIKYVPKHSLMQFLARYDLYKCIADVPGDIIELGVCGGRGLFSFIQSVFIHEPQYQWRRIIGFDTFEGFTEIHEKDDVSINTNNKLVGSFANDSYKELCGLKTVHESFRFIQEREQIFVIKGDVTFTIPDFLEKNPGLIISLLYCDLDLYIPTKAALDLLWDRIPKGGVIVLDEAIMREWPGEAIALHEKVGIGNCALRKIPYLKQFYFIKT